MLMTKGLQGFEYYTNFQALLYKATLEIGVTKSGNTFRGL